MGECQIERLTGKPCHNEAVVNIDLNGTTKGDLNLNVCQRHLNALTKATKQTTESEYARQQRQGW